MSLPAYRWAIKQRVANASERAVLSVLADFADDKGVSFPSVGTIAALCGMSRRGVLYTLKRLKERELLTSKPFGSGRRYYFAMHNGGATAAPVPHETGAMDAHPCATVAPDQRNDCTLTGKNPVNEPLGAGAPKGEEGGGKTKAKANGVRQDDKRERDDRHKRGTRLAADWQPPPEEIARIERELPQVDWRAETEKFRDYWIAKPGPAGSKLDWPATWRNWMRNSLLYSRGRSSGGGTGGYGAASMGISANAPPPGDPWDARIRMFKERGLWLPEWGPKPGEEGYRPLHKRTDASSQVVDQNPSNVRLPVSLG